MLHESQGEQLGQRRGGEFFATLSRELLQQCDYTDRPEARASIFEYIEVFIIAFGCIRRWQG